MKTSFATAATFVLFGLAAQARAATSTYQVTGPVIEFTATKVVIQKDTEKWEIARMADTKVSDELKVGSKITVQYTMTATTITAKPEKAEKPAVVPVKPIVAPAKPAKKAA